MKQGYVLRRIIGVIFILATVAAVSINHPNIMQSVAPPQSVSTATGPAIDVLNSLAVKGRSPKTGYARTQFGDGWTISKGCDTREIILRRDMTNVTANDKCQVISGTLNDPYTGKIILFSRGESSSSAVQIDHVVALSNAWQTGAQQLTVDQRVSLANDPLELLAVDGPTNQQKSDGDAATWLPSNKLYRCQYVSRQVAVKSKYKLWVTQSEKNAITAILSTCPGQILPQ
ncbi:MAG: HNH endonuclease family protein [Candidatus Saccharimonadales bacterium]